jgi:hypothetical protein
MGVGIGVDTRVGTGVGKRVGMGDVSRRGCAGWMDVRGKVGIHMYIEKMGTEIEIEMEDV